MQNNTGKGCAVCGGMGMGCCVAEKLNIGAPGLVLAFTTQGLSAVRAVEDTLSVNGSVMSFTHSIMDPFAFFKVKAVYP